jgi:signal peptide peptidase SppA
MIRRKIMKDRAITKFLDSTPWAMEPARLETLKQVVADHISGKNVAIAKESEGEDSDSFQVTSGIAVIPIVGTIKKRAYGLEAMSGARTTIDIQNDIQTALDNSDISGIVLDIDSPGGTVDGTKELADFIKSADKPVVAYANGLMASAAMWIGSAADYIVGFDTANIGSIGVIVQHQDWSRAEEEAGLKTTYIYAGKYKAFGNSSEPLTDESKEYIQSKVDKLYTMFVNDIANNRNLDVQYVLDKLATAETFLAEEARELKLIDSVGNINDAIAYASKLGNYKKEKQMADENYAQELEAMKAQLEEANSKISALVESAESAKAEKEELEAKIAAEKHEEKVKEMFSAAKVDDAFVSAMCEVDESVASKVAEILVAKQEQIDSALAEYTTPTEGASTEHVDEPEITSVDDATKFIMSRDKCDIDEATDKVVAEFPELFKK